MTFASRTLGTLVVLLFLVAGCNKSSGGGGVVGPTVPLSGVISYDRVPIAALQGRGLDYPNTMEVPARGVVVEGVGAGGFVFDTTTTDALGNYTLQVPEKNTSMRVRVKARLSQPGVWDVRVVDNTSNKALYSVQGPLVDPNVVATVDLHALSGWTGSSYGNLRAAAPFAVLDSVYEALTLVQAQDANLSLPLLKINWSERNTTQDGDRSRGLIGGTFFDTGQGEIWLLGDEDNDTDEYDAHVIAHELAHYLTLAVSRVDSLGGAHVLGDRIDPRVAFDEGFATALSAIFVGDPLYADTFGRQQSRLAVAFNVENNNLFETTEGWFSELSASAIAYDLFDQASDGADQIALGFGPLYRAWRNLGAVDSFATLYSFASLLKAARPNAIPDIDAILDDEDVSSLAADEWDSTATETNNGGLPFVLPVYHPLFPGGAADTLTSTGDGGNYNQLGNRAFLFFQVTTPGGHQIHAQPTGNGDAVIVLYRMGGQIGRVDANGPGQSEVMVKNLQRGTYLAEVYDWNVVNGTSQATKAFNVWID